MIGGRGRPPSFTNAERIRLWRQILDMRSAGKNCREVSQALNIREDQVWKLSQDARSRGFEIPKRAPPQVNPKPRNLKDNLLKLIDEWDIVTIERGAGGGYIITLDDDITLEEYPDLAEALQAARAELEAN